MDKEYYDLLDAWREERNSSEILEIDADFYSDMANYSKKLREQTRMLDKTTLKGKITEKEKDYVEKMLNDLSRIRLRKIIQAELNGRPISSAKLSPEEKALHSDLRRLIAKHRKEMKSIFTGRRDDVKEKEAEVVEDKRGEETQGVKVVRFVKALPAIMGVDMKTYGPFEPEDVAALPEENAENLIRRGFAKVVEIKE